MAHDCVETDMTYARSSIPLATFTLKERESRTCGGISDMLFLGKLIEGAQMNDIYVDLFGRRVVLRCCFIEE